MHGVVEAPMATPAAAVLSPASRVQRVLARFELACPSLRDFQVSVEVSGRSTELVLLPAAKRPRGTVEFVFTPRGGLRSCLYPQGLSNGQLASIEDLAWALREALGGIAVAEAPAAETSRSP
jgi:hypothetical protein